MNRLGWWLISLPVACILLYGIGTLCGGNPPWHIARFLMLGLISVGLGCLLIKEGKDKK